MKRPINLRLDEDLVLASDALAAAMGIDRTELIARGLRRELLLDDGHEFVYVLMDEDHVVRYVGRSRHPRIRLREHIAEARANPGSRKSQWLTDLLEAGRTPNLVIIDDAEVGAEVADLERYWIEHFAKAGKLTNAPLAGVVRGGLKSSAAPQRSIRIPDDLAEVIEAEAKAQERSFSWVVVRWLKDRAAAEAEHAPPSPAVVRSNGLGKGYVAPRPKGGKR